MGILSNKLVIGLIALAVLVMLILIGFYCGVRWTSQDQSVLDGASDQLTADLEQTRVQLEAWSNDFLNEFP